MAFIDRAFDAFYSRVLESYTSSRRPSLSVGVLGEARMRARERAIASHRAAALALCTRMDQGDRDAAEAYGALAENALVEMRRDVLREARTLGAPEALMAYVHARFADTDELEHLDDPALDQAMRVRILEELDATNELGGNYRAFVRAMEPLLNQSGTTRVLDLAAGHGGFAIAATRVAHERGLDLRFCASDLKNEYLDLGRAICAREGIHVDFEVRDALDLRGADYDIITCTQSLHHFPPALIARMFREAMRAARRGVVFVDGCRSMAHGAAMAALGIVRWRDPAWSHDAWLSFRRFFVPEELAVLTQLGPEGDQVEAKWMRPGYCLIRWQR